MPKPLPQPIFGIHKVIMPARMKTGLISLVILITFWSSVLFAQKYTNEGTDFWFGYPHVAEGPSAAGLTYQVHITATNAASGLLTVDALGFPVVPAVSIPFTIAPYTVYTIDFPLSVFPVCCSGSTIITKPVHITSTSPIAVFASKSGLSKNTAGYPVSNSPTTSSIMPTTSLGSRYFITTKLSVFDPNSIHPTPRDRTCDFSVTSLLDTIQVAITYPRDIRNISFQDGAFINNMKYNLYN